MIKQSDNNCKATFTSRCNCHFIMNVESQKICSSKQHILIALHSARACKCTSNLHYVISNSHYVILFHAILRSNNRIHYSLNEVQS